MNTQQIRRAYLQFFQDKGHVVIPRALLVPQNDPSTLFTGSGMQPMVPYLLGEEHPEGVRLANSQVCFRAQDIEDVGDDKHTTAFEMLGNWSLGDYFKQDQIAWIAEFLFDVVGVDPERFYVSCYIGNEKYNIPRDNEAVELWKEQFAKRGIDAKVVEIGAAENGAKMGMQGGRIFLYDGKENWWSRNGDEEGTVVGDPCGPDSEMFYDFGEEFHDEARWGKPHPASDSPRFFEIGNNVFMAYRKTSKGFEKLEKPNIDHGAGLERIAAAALNSPDIFRVSLLWQIVERLEAISGKDYASYRQPMQVIADHIKGAAFLAVDGIVPSNKAQGYVMRRLMRRAIRFAFDLGVEQNFVQEVVPVVTELYKTDFPEVAEREAEVVAVLVREEKAFRQTLRKGLREFDKMADSLGSGDPMTGEHIFKLYDTYGFPVELTLEEAFKKDVTVAEDWRTGFEACMQNQRMKSQTAAKGTFKGGLADHSEITTKYHTATHLMYMALRMVLGDHVIQRGSNITAQRLRFDFSHPEKVTPEQIAEVERIVNQQIERDWPVSWREEVTADVLGKVLGAFGDRYGDKVKIYTIGDPDGENYSREICGGPHVEHTGQLAEGNKRFKITKEEASSAGVRRIKAVLV
ncbi:alanine--tRNA ligase [Candidatus Saccharibacteria bacterium]|nr:MAG: alanine--tRNA ligase [Candidatus Saccharibacteria bacterium]